MKRVISQKLHNRRGLTRAAAILLVLIAILVVVISIPIYAHYQEHADEFACAAALDSAQRQIDILANFNSGAMTAEEAQAEAERAMLGWDDLCPAGGECHIVKHTGNQPYKVVCGLHDSDLSERTRLNAASALEKVRTAVQIAQLTEGQFPESVTIILNGKEQVCRLVEEDPGLKYGTLATRGLSGTVVYYGLVGKGVDGFAPGTSEKTGTVWFLSFADENHCANWRVDGTWYGDSYPH